MLPYPAFFLFGNLDVSFLLIKDISKQTVNPSSVGDTSLLTYLYRNMKTLVTDSEAWLEAEKIFFDTFVYWSISIYSYIMYDIYMNFIKFQHYLYSPLFELGLNRWNILKEKKTKTKEKLVLQIYQLELHLHNLLQIL